MVTEFIKLLSKHWGGLEAVFYITLQNFWDPYFSGALQSPDFRTQMSKQLELFPGLLIYI